MNIIVCEWLFPLKPGDLPGQFKVSCWGGPTSSVLRIHEQCRVQSVCLQWLWRADQRHSGMGMRYPVAAFLIYEVSSGETTLWRAVLGRGRCAALAGRLLFSDGSVSACGVLASPTSSRRNLNLDRKSCQTTYQPETERENKVLQSG